MEAPKTQRKEGIIKLDALSARTKSLTLLFMAMQFCFVKYSSKAVLF